MASVSVESGTASTVSCGLSSNNLIRRTANPHPNIWGYDFVHSLKSPYAHDSSYRERAETLISEIKVMLGGGELMMTPSAYDTAWVARVPSIDGSACPQFPQTVEWILKSQLKDGSWGTESHFLLSDRLLATLSCVLALLKWKVADVQVEQGIEFIKRNLQAIKDERDQDSLVTDFEIIFPSLLKEAQSFHLGLPYDLPYIRLLQTKRQERLANLSRDKIHSGTLLSSLEGNGHTRYCRVGNNNGCSKPRWVYCLRDSLSLAALDSSYRERAETLVSEIKVMLGAAIGGGELMMTPSAYDTAWVARVLSIDGSACPQFPQTVEWILKNQLKDGSWGTESHFLLSDRLLATLSCVLALIKWKVADVQVEQGIEFIKKNLQAIKDERDQDSLVTDFEIIFPSLLKEAQSFHLGLPYDLPYIRLLQTKRQERLANLSRDKIHSGTLLSSLEGNGHTRYCRVGNNNGCSKPRWVYCLRDSLSLAALDSSYRERAETLVSEIKVMLGAAIGGGELMMTPSAYDTAWVARVLSIDGSACPQFPQTVEWILKNQLKDGSWGTESHFLLSDRLLATLSCVLALLKWKVADVQIEQGIEFIKRSLQVIKDERDQDSLVTDFEIIFPSLLKEAQSLHLGLPYDLPYIRLLQTKRQERLANLSMEKIHGGTLLSSLEGIQDIVEWETIMDVQNQDGSFLSSPASTACVFMHTGDMKCLEFLNNVLTKFGSSVPCLYPVDLLERLLIVDNVERLGIDRHFEKEIKEALDYVYRHWNDRGIGWGRLSPIADLETTALGFRLLRLHRYNVSPVVLDNFKDADGEFFCSTGQFNKDVASMLSLYRASQLAFPEENILDEAKSFSTQYLREALEKSETFSAWNHRQSLSEEIKYALKTSWHASVPRVEAKRYCQVYRPDYARLAKSVYKLPKVNNEKILELAKLDFNIVQSIHQEEMKNVTSWFRDSGLPLFTFARERPLEFFFLIAAGTYEPQYAKCRFLFTKVACLQTVLDDMEPLVN